MRLADFILANMEPILAEWEVFARDIWPGIATADPATLRNDAEAMLRATATDMKAEQTAAEQSAKSRGRGGDGPQSARVDRASAAHGVGRVASGFDLAALLAEYRSLRASVIRLWRESKPGSDLNGLDDITRFNESIDQSLAAAAVAYVQIVERERRAALDEQVSHARELRAVNDALLVSSVRQHELMAQAGAANRAKDRFLAVLSHELRTPLTPVVMTLSALDLNTALPDDVRDDVRMIRRNVELEARLIDDLLDLSRITTGKLHLSFESIDVNWIFRQVCNTFRPSIQEKGINLHCDLTETPCEVIGDAARLQQVFWNLLSNATKFTSEGGHIYIESRRTADARVCLTVRDTGIGLEPDIIPRIFDAFEQGEARITRQFGGLGLGLAIAKLLVERHSGMIRAQSDGPNKGTMFIVELPVPTPQDSAALASKAEGVSGANAGPLRLLIVEDHPQTSAVLGKLLRAKGHSVRTANTGARALTLAGENPFDLMVCDLGLPDMTGHELMERIKQNYGITGIALSGYGMEEDVKRGSQAGFSAHLVKPVSIEQLEQAIRRVADSQVR